MFNTASFSQVATVPLEFPGGLAITPDGAFAYVTREIPFPGSVSVLETATRTVVATLNDVGRILRGGVAISPDGAFAYVSHFQSRPGRDGVPPGSDGKLSTIETTGNTVVETIDYDGEPSAVAVSPDGSLVYVVVGPGFGSVVVIDAGTRTVEATVAVGQTPRNVAFTPDGAFAYVTNFNSNSVSVIETSTNLVVETIPDVAELGEEGGGPWDVGITPDGTVAYVTNDLGNEVSVIETATNTVMDRIGVGFQARGLAITPDGEFVWVANFADFSISVIEASDNSVTATIAVSDQPQDIVISPLLTPGGDDDEDDRDDEDDEEDVNDEDDEEDVNDEDDEEDVNDEDDEEDVNDEDDEEDVNDEDDEEDVNDEDGAGSDVEAEADLDGSQEVPSVVTNMTGEVAVNIEDGQLEFDLEVSDNTHDIFAAHIHCAPPGMNGPVGITLFTGSFTAASGTLAEGTITAPDAGNGCGWADIAAVAAAIQSGNTYVNVHTTAPSGGVPSGEIRGNLPGENSAAIPAPLSFSFADPVGDHLQVTPLRQLNPPAGVIDVMGLHFTFENTTGDYEITLTASAANPFLGGFRVNVLLFNPEAGTTTQDPGSFLDQLNDFFLTTPSTEITVTGTDPRLLSWKAGDRVAACEGASFVEFGPCLGGLGLPDGVAGFGTGVFTFSTPPPFGSPKGLDVFFTAPPATISH
jgi:YVTN family beta-propeller protein